MPRERLVYVITDAPERSPWPKRWHDLRELLRPTALIGLLAAPLWALTAIPVGLLLGWPPFVLFIAGVVAAPLIANLTDLLAARLGFPSLAWVASRLITRRPAITQKETRRNG